MIILNLTVAQAYLIRDALDTCLGQMPETEERAAIIVLDRIEAQLELERGRGDQPGVPD